MIGLMTFVIIYLDDILVYSPDKQTHTQHVMKVLKRLHDHQWYCKLKKCDFAQTRVEYLGHFISNGTISIDPCKTQAVTYWKIPFQKPHRSTKLSWSSWILLQVYTSFLVIKQNHYMNSLIKILNLYSKINIQML